MKNKPQAQMRYARLVSVFIKTLIKSRMLDPKKMYTEVAVVLSLAARILHRIFENR